MEKCVSIVVPVYNIENYLEKCIKSLMNQTYENLDIVLVNDGSKDSSLEICKTYASKDERIQIVDKPNGGLSDARNFGIKAAKGELIAFIDGDDFIKPEMIEKMVKRLEETDSDVCVCDMSYLYDSGREDYASGGTFDVGDPSVDVSLLTINNSACNKLYKTQLFNDFTFPVGWYYEDLATVPVILSKCKRICKVNEPFYIYYQRSGSIAHSANKKIFHIYKAVERCITYFKEHGANDDMISKMKECYVLHGLDLTTLRIKDFDDKGIRKEYLKENMDNLRKYYPDYKKSNYYKNCGFKKKLIFKLLEMNCLDLVLKIYDK